MTHKLAFVNSRLLTIRRAGLYRKITPSLISGSEIIINNRRMINACSNDYLGMLQSIGMQKTDRMQSSSRLLSGSDEKIHKLESILAKVKSFNSSLVFPTGYMANIGVLTALAGKDDYILSDALNHASIIDACRLSGAKTIVYRHNDMDDLEKKCKKFPKRKFIVTEGTFSMDGDLSNARRICELANKYNAITILDDAHGDFALGHNGMGSWADFGKQPDVYVSSLSKALGSFGGYIASNSNLVDLCINTAKTLIYTSAIPKHIASHASTRILHNSRSKRQKLLAKNSLYMKKYLHKAGYDVKKYSHIIPIHIGDENIAIKFSKRLAKDGVYAQAVRYPTVEKGRSRIRLSITANMSLTQMRIISNAIESAGCFFKII
ncbi:MAG: 8-amino-7-oxononanoate synthase protein [Cenarchaeum symbiont of Oopsacas minuta]|nr:8-amino-7-oxononanoate synthase protein [Cenarchaeum symbiont of Oopsacas minuta]